MELPEGRLGWDNPRQGRACPDERAFGAAMARWRVVRGQEGFEGRAAELWSVMSGWADRGVGSFHCGDGSPSAFHEAVQSGSVEAIRLAARAAGPGQTRERIDEEGQLGEDPRGTGEHWTPLCSAWAWAGSRFEPGGCAAVVAVLLELGAHPEGCAMSPGLPLRVMAMMGQAGAVEALVAAGADPRARVASPGSLYGDAGGSTLMHLAMRSHLSSGAPGRVDTWRALLRAGADPWALDDLGRSALDVARAAGWGQEEALMEAMAMADAIVPGPGSGRRRGI